MDELAYELQMDPIELRLRNCAETDPVTGNPWSSNALRECYGQAADRFGWGRRNPEPRSMRDGRWLVGTGMATAAVVSHPRLDKAVEVECGCYRNSSSASGVRTCDRSAACPSGRRSAGRSHPRYECRTGSR
jgi:xanthine dehydrogenase YagR molybdenum-binding subunit